MRTSDPPKTALRKNQPVMDPATRRVFPLSSSEVPGAAAEAALAETTRLLAAEVRAGA
jgi:hypothetical protein